jgi:hypothetical protein
MNAVHGQALAAKTQALVKIQAVAIVMAMQPTSVTAGATGQPIIQAANGTEVIAANQPVAMEPTRVALWDTLAIIQQPVKTPAWAARKSRDHPYSASPKYLQN